MHASALKTRDFGINPKMLDFFNLDNDKRNVTYKSSHDFKQRRTTSEKFFIVFHNNIDFDTITLIGFES